MNQPCLLQYFATLFFAWGLSALAIAETAISPKSTLNRESLVASPWEKATLTQTLNSPTKINTVRFSPDGKILVTISANQITLWQTTTGEIQRIVPGHSATELNMDIAPIAVAFSPDSRFLATVTWSQGLLTPDHSLIVWDLEAGERVLQLQESEGCRQVLFDTQGKIIYAACGAGVTAWSFPEGKKQFSFDTAYPLETISLSPDGQVMATVDANLAGGQPGEKSNQIQLWQLNSPTPELLQVLHGHNNDIAQIQFTADGRRLVSSSYDGKINVWNWQQGEIYPQTKNLHSDRGMFSLSPNSRLIAGNFHSSAMTNLITGLPLRSLMAASHLEADEIVAFGPQGQLFAKVKSVAESTKSQIALWQTDIDLSLAPKTVNNTAEDNYLSLPLEQYWDITKQTTADSLASLPSSSGQDPQAIAAAALGLKETIESEQQTFQLDYPQDNLAVVQITQTNLADDSVRDRRYLVKFAPYGEKSKQQWQVVWAGQQFRCQPNRGHQDWGKGLCQ